MGSSLSLIHLPAQSGKTRKMTELINRWKHLINYTGNGTGDVNFIFTSNTKLLTKQTAGRIHTEVDKYTEMSDLSSDDDDLSVVLDVKEKESKTLAWISSGTKLSINDVFAKITSDDDDNEINNVICCTNKSRMKNVWELLSKLNKKFIKRNFNKRINIWVDEADSCIKLWGPYLSIFDELIDSKLVKNVVMVSATMVPVYKHLHSNGIEPILRTYENTHSQVYHKYSESKLCHTFSESAKNVVLQLKTILDNNPEMVSPGTRLFCPGNKAKKSHEELCDELLVNGFNVLLLNGSHKEIRFCNGRPAIEIASLLDTDLEVSKTLNRLYHDPANQLSNNPFAVTGNLCIGRGITFVSQIDTMEFLFTHGIIPDATNGDDGYQMVARCCGNIKGFSSYKVPNIFVSERTDALIRQQENLAVDFAKKFFQEGIEEPTVKVAIGMLNEVIGLNKVIGHEERDKRREFVVGSMNEFDTLEQANAFCKKIKKGSRIEKETHFKNEVGEFVCSTTKKTKKFSYDEFMNESASWNPTSLMNVKDLAAGKVSKVIKPVYRGDKVVWIVRWAVDVMKAGADMVEIPTVDNKILSDAIRHNKYSIKHVSPHKIKICISA